MEDLISIMAEKARTYPNGDEYVGEWKDNTRDSWGTYTYTSGDGYEGEHKDGLGHGQGMAFYGGSGRSVVGIWREGVFLYEIENSSQWDSRRA